MAPGALQDPGVLSTVGWNTVAPGSAHRSVIEAWAAGLKEDQGKTRLGTRPEAHTLARSAQG